MSIDLFSRSSSSDPTNVGDVSWMAVSDDISDAGAVEGRMGSGEDELGGGVMGLGEDGGGWEGVEGVSGVIFGRKAELISPIPTKKSSARTIMLDICAYIGRVVDCEPTRYDLDEIRRPLPDVGPVVDDHHHGRVTRKKSL